MAVIHHTAICVRDLDASLRFWRDGLGFEQLMDATFEGDWRTLLHAQTDSLRSIFLGDPAAPMAGVVELVDLGDVPDRHEPGTARAGFLLVSLMADVESTLVRLAGLGLGGAPRRIESYGTSMAVVEDPDGVVVELIDTGAATALGELIGGP